VGSLLVRQFLLSEMAPLGRRRHLFLRAREALRLVSAAAAHLEHAARKLFEDESCSSTSRLGGRYSRSAPPANPAPKPSADPQPKAPPVGRSTQRALRRAASTSSQLASKKLRSANAASWRVPAHEQPCGAERVRTGAGNSAGAGGVEHLLSSAKLEA
jgi:hypothetical protein